MIDSFRSSLPSRRDFIDYAKEHRYELCLAASIASYAIYNPESLMPKPQYLIPAAGIVMDAYRSHILNERGWGGIQATEVESEDQRIEREVQELISGMRNQLFIEYFAPTLLKKVAIAAVCIGLGAGLMRAYL